MIKAVSLLLTLVLLLGVFAGITPSASAAAADATLSVDLDPSETLVRSFTAPQVSCTASAVRMYPLRTPSSRSNRKFFARRAPSVRSIRMATRWTWRRHFWKAAVSRS